MTPNAALARCLPRRPRSSFSLLFTLGTAAYLFSVASAEAKQVAATALFQICSDTPSILGEPINRPHSHQNYEILKKTQVALLHSYYVLNAAVRNPKIASLSVFESLQDPVEWLQEHVETEIEKDSEILAIRLRGPAEQAEELVQIVDAVAKAYRDEVIYEGKQRSLATRDLLARSLQNLNKEIERKFTEFLDIAEEAGRIESGGGQIMQQIDLKRLDRIDAEIMRLESEQIRSETTADPEVAKFIERRIEELRERQTELEKKITACAESSVELTTRQRDLDRLQHIADEMSVRLERMDIEANAPERIRQIQQALVAPAE
jgi:hypothetical protein